MVGKIEWPVFRLLQEEADKWGKRKKEEEEEEEEEKVVPLTVNEKEVGFLRLSLSLKEDSHGLFLSKRPRRVPLPPQVTPPPTLLLIRLSTTQSTYQSNHPLTHPPTYRTTSPWRTSVVC